MAAGEYAVGGLGDGSKSRGLCSGEVSQEASGHLSWLRIHTGSCVCN